MRGRGWCWAKEGTEVEARREKGRNDRRRKTAKREPKRADRRASADDVLRNSYARHDSQFGLPVLQLFLSLYLYLSLFLVVPLIALAIWPAQPLSLAHRCWKLIAGSIYRSLQNQYWPRIRSSNLPTDPSLVRRIDKRTSTQNDQKTRPEKWTGRIFLYVVCVCGRVQS